MHKTLKDLIKREKTDSLPLMRQKIRETIQEIILSGLAHTNFFKYIAFYGGTCLRMFHHLNRFSEDLDFSLAETNLKFELTDYFSFLDKWLTKYGLNCSIVTKTKPQQNTIQRCYVKANELELIKEFYGKDFNASHIHRDSIFRIKIEVDLSPTIGASYEWLEKKLRTPYKIRLYDLPSIFASKIAALLCRSWKNRVKGRDFYDFWFLATNNAKVNLEYLTTKLSNAKLIKPNNNLTLTKLKRLLIEKFKKVDYAKAKNDVIKFINNPNLIKDWSPEFFIALTNKL